MDKNLTFLVPWDIGKGAITPESAVGQPDENPFGSVYRFDPSYFKGLDSWSLLRERIEGSCEGCKLWLQRGRNAASSRRVRVAEWHLGCTCFRVRQKSKAIKLKDRDTKNAYTG